MNVDVGVDLAVNPLLAVLNLFHVHEHRAAGGDDSKVNVTRPYEIIQSIIEPIRIKVVLELSDWWAFI